MVIPIKPEQVAGLFSEGIETVPATLSERRHRRDALLRESFAQRARRVGASLAYAAAPNRLRGLAAGLDFLARERSIAPANLPSPEHSLAYPDGLCGLAADLSPAAVMDGYSRGLLLFAPVGPAAWWSPSQRSVAVPGSIGRGAFVPCPLELQGLRATMDRAFEEVLAVCSRPDRAGRRLGFGPKLTRAYAELHEAGFAHSFEIGYRDGEPPAGGFGISVGRTFVTTACFGPVELAASGLVVLDRHLAEWGYATHEARLGTTPGARLPEKARRLGFMPMARQEFVARLKANLCGGRLSRWRIDPLLCRDPAPERLAAASDHAPLASAA